MKPFAIYFPQYYPTPTNDKAWGHGFTDWSLVANANLRDHWPRRAPRRGFYDGADPSVHDAQLREMIDAGLGGMAVYHYWFYSHQELPAFEQNLIGGAARPELPWFLVWASEGWSRRWMGDPSAIATLSASPNAAQIDAHCRHLLRCFEQSSYFRWRGKPLFVWYHLSHFDDPRQLVEQYRTCLRSHGVDIAVAHFVKNPFDSEHAALAEASFLFEPRLYFGMRRAGRSQGAKRAFDAVKRWTGDGAAQRLLTLADRVQQRGQVHAAEDHLAYLRSAHRASFSAALPGTVQEVLCPGWNNTPRYLDRHTALKDLKPEVFAGLVQAASARETTLPPLINAWNEWSEGAAIEPCAYLGTRYLDALHSLSNSRPPVAQTQTR